MNPTRKNFFNLVLNCCANPDIYVNLSRLHWIRAMGHLFALAVLCAVTFTVFHSLPLSKEVGQVCKALQREFGDLVWDAETGLLPDKKPRRPRQINFGPACIDYRPDGLTETTENELEHDLYKIGFLWAPKSVTGWMDLRNGKRLTYQALLNQEHVFKFFDFELLPSDKVPAFNRTHQVKSMAGPVLALLLPLKENMPLSAFFPLEKRTSFSDQARKIYLWFSLQIFLSFVFEILRNAVFYALIFSFIFSLSMKKHANGMNFRGYFTLSVYTAFPAIIIGTLFTCANAYQVASILDFSNIFLFSYVIYLFIATKKIKDVTDHDKSQPVDLD